jgi:RNA polymerase sigma factor (sigma-70 family)
MSPEESAAHLSHISTRWDLLFQAHQGQATTAGQARQELLRRYCGAIYRYLLAALRDPAAAEELSQEFALRFVRGAFKNADPEKGRFRDFVKTSLYHLIVDYRRRRQSQPGPLPEHLAGLEEPTDAGDAEFLRHWRGEVLGRTWEALAAHEVDTGQLFHTVLRWRVEHPQSPAAELAEQLSRRTGKSYSEGNVRVTLHRAREKFADLLLAEVACSLQSDEKHRMEQELIDLDLLPYCRSALDRRENSRPG